LDLKCYVKKAKREGKKVLQDRPGTKEIIKYQDAKRANVEKASDCNGATK